MNILPTKLPGVLIIEPDVYRDARGWFLETYHADKYKKGGIPLAFVQDNCSSSVRGTLRGLHAQMSRPQGKLVRVTSGEIFDVAVDIRRGSPTFGILGMCDVNSRKFQTDLYSSWFCPWVLRPFRHRRS